MQFFIYRDNVASAGLTKGNGLAQDHTNYLIGGGWQSPIAYITPLTGASAHFGHCAVEFHAGTYSPRLNQACDVMAPASAGSLGFVGAYAPY